MLIEAVSNANLIALLSKLPLLCSGCCKVVIIKDLLLTGRIQALENRDVWIRRLFG